MERVFNFSAGPATLPVEVLEQASKDMLNYNGCGMSVMEMSHRSSEYGAIHAAAKESLRSLLNLDEDHEVLFLQGGASFAIYHDPYESFIRRPIGFLRDLRLLGEEGLQGSGHALSREGHRLVGGG